MSDIKAEIEKTLFSMQDLAYRDFTGRLIPTVDKSRIIGVRTPNLRKYSKELAGRDDIDLFLNSLPHRYYEEDNIHAFVLEREKNFDKLISELDKFLPFVNNWATCDSMSPVIFKKYRKELLPDVYRWIKSRYIYEVRFAIGVLMKFFLDEYFDEKYLKTVSQIKSDEYYINMMQAWYFATALAKQYDKTLPYIEKARLCKQTHNMTIKKAIESYRITDEQKEYLKKFIIK